MHKNVLLIIFSAIFVMIMILNSCAKTFTIDKQISVIFYKGNYSRDENIELNESDFEYKRIRLYLDESNIDSNQNSQLRFENPSILIKGTNTNVIIARNGIFDLRNNLFSKYYNRKKLREIVFRENNDTLNNAGILDKDH